ncbi:uncharacterized protein LOC133869725 [Alnus glutinosa]|uniref:uncharacterized protein LOC133869725 n=1 Tax=Alnus glutinosa TaxID=3517 RepID=UPI002D76A947|nr:uncharacterized protein LOC133869725 [Alnus glutinosa]
MKPPPPLPLSHWPVIDGVGSVSPLARPFLSPLSETDIVSFVQPHPSLYVEPAAFVLSAVGHPSPGVWRLDLSPATPQKISLPSSVSISRCSSLPVPSPPPVFEILLGSDLVLLFCVLLKGLLHW